MSLEPSSDPKYLLMIRTLKAILTEGESAQFILHTPVGAVTVGRWDFFYSGFVIIRGIDENKKNRFLVFSEEQVSSFPLELKPQSESDPQTVIGFTPPRLDRVEE